MPNIAYIALGSNLGNRRQTLESAIDLLGKAESIVVTRVSSFIENPAVGGPADSPSFLNGAAELQTRLSPAALLNQLLMIEQTLGRYRREKWGPRTIDLDLLLFGDQVIRDEGLTIPHPLMDQRSFVLQPLNEIAPAVVHPVLLKTIAELCQALNVRSSV